MREALDHWYQRERDYLLRAGEEFAKRHPKTAGRLGLSKAAASDPHVERLIQAFAFLNARTMIRLDDSFPEIVDALLGVLFPHQLLPIPAMSVVELTLDRSQKELFQGFQIDRGSLLDVDRNSGGIHHFRTCAPVSVYPLEVRGVELSGKPFPALGEARVKDARALLRISLAGFDPCLPLSAIPADQLQFFVAEPNYERAARLMQLICSNTLQIVAQPKGQGQPKVLRHARVQARGLEPENGVLPRDSRTFHPYQLLTEYFVMPARFLFFEICGLSEALADCSVSSMDLFLLLNDADAELQGTLSADSLRLGCTPIVNLFSRPADGIPLDYRTAEYRLIPDARNEDLLEVYSVDELAFDDQSGEQRMLQPFFSRRLDSGGEPGGYWHAQRRPRPIVGDTGRPTGATEVYLSLVDHQFSSLKPQRGMLLPQVTCFNRTLPDHALRQQQSVSLRFQLGDGSGLIGEIRCHVPPTTVYRRELGRQNLWALVSQLSLNHLSLAGSESGLEALRKILSLNDPADTQQTRQLIAGIDSLRTEPCVRRRQQSFLRGVAVSILLRDEHFSGDSPWMFSRILNAFFAAYAPINSFTVLEANTIGRTQQGLSPWSWPEEGGCRRIV